MHDFWPGSGLTQLERTDRGWLRPTDAYWRRYLALPELALVPESCAAEVALRAALVAQPAHAVTPEALAAVRDDDARANYALFLAFRDALLAAGTLEAYYLQLMRSGHVDIPPAFVDRLVQAIVHNLLVSDEVVDPFMARAAEMLFRTQQLSLQDGHMLAADRDTVELLGETGGMGDLGRLLLQNNTPVRSVTMDVLNANNAADYWRTSERHSTVLDLTHEISNDLGHGVSFTMTKAHSGLNALAHVLERWLQHLLGIGVDIQPLQKIDDAAWRWHVGLDVDATALLNDLYEDQAVEPERMQRLISLFRLRFRNPQEMRADVAGKPVYLGLAMSADNILKLKPQNLLLNLPLAAAM